MLWAIRLHFKPVLQENLVWAAPQSEINVLACLREGKKKKANLCTLAFILLRVKTDHFIYAYNKHSNSLFTEMVYCIIKSSIPRIRLSI